ncbi:hypothetical protein Tco_0508995, partial [Tanacetum coccineum]
VIINSESSLGSSESIVLLRAVGYLFSVHEDEDDEDLDEDVLLGNDEEDDGDMSNDEVDLSDLDDDEDVDDDEDDGDFMISAAAPTILEHVENSNPILVKSPHPFMNVPSTDSLKMGEGGLKRFDLNEEKMRVMCSDVLDGQMIFFCVMVKGDIICEKTRNSKLRMQFLQLVMSAMSYGKIDVVFGGQDVLKEYELCEEVEKAQTADPTKAKKGFNEDFNEANVMLESLGLADEDFLLDTWHEGAISMIEKLYERGVSDYLHAVDQGIRLDLREKVKRCFLGNKDDNLSGCRARTGMVYAEMLGLDRACNEVPPTVGMNHDIPAPEVLLQFPKYGPTVDWDKVVSDHILDQVPTLNVACALLIITAWLDITSGLYEQAEPEKDKCHEDTGKKWPLSLLRSCIYLKEDILVNLKKIRGNVKGASCTLSVNDSIKGGDAKQVVMKRKTLTDVTNINAEMICVDISAYYQLDISAFSTV